MHTLDISDKAKRILEELDDYSGPISKLVAKLKEVETIEGDIDVTFDAGYNNVSIIAGVSDGR
ncbi:hypothetical protein [Escherichia phage EP_H11]|nr:hypothetical protein [Escherichia phage EP_H11]